MKDNRAEGRYELQTSGGVAFIDYRRDGNVVTMLHAEVPAAVRAGGVGSRLVRGALDLVRGEGGKVIPRCPFVAAYIGKHPDAQDLLAEPRPLNRTGAR
ncbi:MAG TPA: GNAT family N-acetyltransferase [Steroidobacteraceae bacterium]|nr:GNAT family N-acetyltransferase [Steroidobacteraceae bacterium]